MCNGQCNAYCARLMADTLIITVQIIEQRAFAPSMPISGFFRCPGTFTLLLNSTRAQIVATTVE